MRLLVGSLALVCLSLGSAAEASPIISLACNDINGVVSYPMATGGKNINGFESDGFAGGRIVLDAQKDLTGDIVGSVVFKDSVGRVIDKEAKGSKVLALMGKDPTWFVMLPNGDYELYTYVIKENRLYVSYHYMNSGMFGSLRAYTAKCVVM